jgi:hypothetical protein
VRKTAVLVAALLVLAGCNAPPTPETPENPQTTLPETTTQTSSSSVNVTEQGASLGDVNATAVWQRVGELVTADAEPPPVVVRPMPAERTRTPEQFERSLGAENATVTDSLVTGRYDENRDGLLIRIWRAPGATDAEVESMLAHEFVHAYQAHLYGFSQADHNLGKLTAREGIAEALAWEYAREYTDFPAESSLAERFSAESLLGRLALAPYYLGAQYARNVTNASAPVRSMSDNRPTTDEQVLHGLAPGTESPRELSVTGKSGDAGVFVAPLVETRGEADLRFLLEYGLGRERAREAAAGWGNDRLATFQSAGGDSYAWVIRWDAPAEATEFEALFADFRANVSEPLRLEPVGETTTVVLSGREAFVENATVSGTPGNVTVAAGD